MNEFSGGGNSTAMDILQGACTTVGIAPMLCILFIGTRMRAIQLTQGDTEKYHLPQPWVQQSMFACVFSLLGQVVVVLLIPVCTGQLHVPVTATGDISIGRARL